VQTLYNNNNNNKTSLVERESRKNRLNESVELLEDKNNPITLIFIFRDRYGVKFPTKNSVSFRAADKSFVNVSVKKHSLF
jgi:hypothetical protein